jgi:hypothetical protein
MNNSTNNPTLILLNNNNIVENIIAFNYEDTDEKTLNKALEIYGNDKKFKIGKNYSNFGIGTQYDETEDKFIPVKDFEGWTFDRATWAWVPPIPYPQDYDSVNVNYYWDINTQNWIPFTRP